MAVTWKKIAFSDHVHTQVVFGGTGTFNSTTGVVITIGATLAGTSYAVTVTPNESGPESIGPIYVAGKSTTQFTVYNMGSEDAKTFDWIVCDYN